MIAALLAAEPTVQDVWLGFGIVGAVLVFWTYKARGALGLVVMAAITGVLWVWRRGELQPEDATDKSAVYVLAFGVLLGFLAAHAIPTKRGA